jgi:hypothetical protein
MILIATSSLRATLRYPNPPLLSFDCNVLLCVECKAKLEICFKIRVKYALEKAIIIISIYVF